MEELTYIKDNKGWLAMDVHGRAARGITKQAARNMYFVLYQANTTMQNEKMISYLRGDNID